MQRAFPQNTPPGTAFAFTPDFVRAYLNPVIRPTSGDDVFAASIEAETKSLATLGEPSIGAFVRGDVANQLLSEVAKSAEAEINARLRLLPQQGTVRVEALVLGAQRISTVVRADHLRAGEGVDLSIRVKASGYVSSGSGVVHLVPVLESLDVLDLTLTRPGLDVTVFLGGMKGALDTSLQFLNSLLDSATITIPTPSLPTVTVPGAPAPLTLPPLVYTGGSAVIAPQGVFVLAALARDPTSSVGAAKAAVAPADRFAVLLDAMRTRWTTSFGDPAARGRGISLVAKTSLIARYLNSVALELQASATTAVNQQAEMPETPIRIVFGGGTACTRRGCERRGCVRRGCDDNCSRADCSRRPGECDWSCLRDGPFGSKFDDPFCLADRARCNLGVEARVAACNVAAEAEMGRCKAAVANCNAGADLEHFNCNASADLELAGCNASADLEFGSCQAYKAASDAVRDALNRLGGIGRVRGAARFQGRVTATLGHFAVDDALTTASVAVTPDVGGTLTGHLDFLPYDIGHLACPIAGQAKFTLGVSTPSRPVTTTATVAFTRASSSQQGRLTITVQPAKYVVDVTPSPYAALLRENPQLLFTCSVLVHGAASAGTIAGNLLPDLRELPDDGTAGVLSVLELLKGRYRGQTDAMALEVAVPPVDLAVGSRTVRLVPDLKDGVLEYGQ